MKKPRNVYYFNYSNLDASSNSEPNEPANRVKNRIKAVVQFDSLKEFEAFENERKASGETLFGCVSFKRFCGDLPVDGDVIEFLGGFEPNAKEQAFIEKNMVKVTLEKLARW